MRTRGKKTINELLPNWKNKGVISFLYDIAPSLFVDQGDSTGLDIIYHGYRSGNKYAGSLVSAYMVNDQVTTEDWMTIIRGIYTVRKASWTRIKATLEEEYNAIHNYDREEIWDGIDTDTWSGTDTQRETDIDRNIHETNRQTRIGEDITENRTTHEGSDENENEVISSVKGFDSEGFVESEKNLSKNTLTPGVTDIVTITDKPGIEYTTENDISKSGETTTSYEKGTSLEKKYGHKISTKGNIGVTTTQQMIEAELKLRTESYYEIIMRDLDKYLCLRVY